MTALRYIVLFALLFTTAGCATNRSKSGETRPLPELERERLRYALDVIAQFQEGWNVKESLPICITLFKRDGQWIIHCDKPQLEQAVSTGTQAFSKPVYFVPPFQIPGSTRRDPPEPLIKGSVIAFGMFSTPGNPASIKLFGDQPWFIVASIDELIELNPTFKDANTEKWTSIFLHEYFHVLQLTNPKIQKHYERYESTPAAFNERTLDALCKDNPAYRKAVQSEFDFMDKALLNGRALTPAQARATLKKWLRMHEKRIERFKSEFKQGDLGVWDSFWTFIEGTANFAGTRYRVDPEYRRITPPRQDPRFESMREHEIGEIYAGRRKEPRLPDFYYYVIGYQLTELLERAHPTWRTEVMNAPGFLVGLIRSL